jgi:hypothetical protein
VLQSVRLWGGGRVSTAFIPRGLNRMKRHFLSKVGPDEDRSLATPTNIHRWRNLWSMLIKTQGQRCHGLLDWHVSHASSVSKLYADRTSSIRSPSYKKTRFWLFTFAHWSTIVWYSHSWIGLHQSRTTVESSHAITTSMQRKKTVCIFNKRRIQF